MTTNYHQWRIIAMAWVMYLIFVPLRERSFDVFLSRPNQVMLGISIIYLIIIAGSMRWPILHFVIIMLMAIYPFGKMVEYQTFQVIKLSHNYGDIVIFAFCFILILYFVVAYIYQSRIIRESVKSDPMKFGISSDYKEISINHWIFSENKEGQKYSNSIMLIAITVRLILREMDKSVTELFFEVLAFIVILLVMNYLVINLCFIVELVKLEKRKGRKLKISPLYE